MNKTVGELGEFPLLERIQAVLADHAAMTHSGTARSIAESPRAPSDPLEIILGIGDDAAVFRPEGTWDWVLTCDAQVAGRHFIPHWASPRSTGHRAMTVNLSDLAAMGAEPRGALVSLGLPSDFLVQDVEELYRGLLDALAPTGAAIIGGNLSGSGPDWFCDITLLGRVERGGALLRSGARAGDQILATGWPGRSAAGLALLRKLQERMEVGGPVRSPGLGIGGRETGPEELRDRRLRFRELTGEFVAAHPWAESLIRAYLSPSARLGAGRYLASMQPAAGPSLGRPGEWAGGMPSFPVTAVIDISDGLPGDLLRICERSAVRAVIDVAGLPPDPPLEEAARFLGLSAAGWRLGPSDDYELLLTVSPDSVDLIRSGLKLHCCLDAGRVGEVACAGLPAVDVRSTTHDLKPPAGWDHFHPFESGPGRERG
jgi:thiamine-monophosphate kinase